MVTAAGFEVRGDRIINACDPPAQPRPVAADLNGDGRPDAVIADTGIECYGATEQGLVIVTRDAAGGWRKLYASPGVPKFLGKRGIGGWPDIENGGRGFVTPSWIPSSPRSIDSTDWPGIRSPYDAHQQDSSPGPLAPCAAAPI